MPSSNPLISDASEWPIEMRYLANSLDTPLPSQLASGSRLRRAVSSRAFPIIEELEELSKRSPEQFAESDSCPEVLDILDLVLSTVSTLRALKHISNHDILRQTIPFWSLLIRSLVSVSYKNSCVMEDVPFVRPRQSHTHATMQDGHASLLVSHVIEDIRPPRPDITRDTQIPEGRSKDIAYYRPKILCADMLASDSDTSYERSEVSTDPTSAQSFHIPLDAHVLTYWPHSHSVVLPFLCVTEEEDIFALMSGSLYQRCAWGIIEPVIGIIFSKTGYVGRVVLGWFEDTGTDPDVLPAVRFAYADETRVDASIGVYDLTDSVSALKFAQFIISLRPHVEAIVAQCSNPIFKRLPWRSDTIDDSECGSEEQWEERIVNWLDSVDRCNNLDKSPQKSTDSCRLKLYSSAMTEPLRRSTRSSSRTRSVPARGGQDSAASGDSLPGVTPADRARLKLGIHPNNTTASKITHATSSTTSASTPEDASSELRGRKLKKADKPSSQGDSSKRSKSADAVACSVLGARPLAGILPTARLSYSSYAHDRKVISLTNLRKTKDVQGVDTSEVNDMLEFYEEITRYMKPPIDQDYPPAIDKRVEGVWDHFLLQVDACPHGENTPELPREFWDIISGCFSSLLWASVGGYSKELGGSSPNEAEARHEWDVLLNLGFVDAHELASGRVVLERPLSLSRNVAADLLQSSPGFDGADFIEIANASFQISKNDRDSLEERLVDPRKASLNESNLLVQTSDLASAAVKHVFDVTQLFDDPKTAKTAILKRAGDEPILGIADAVLVLPLERTHIISEPLIRIAQSRDSLQTTKVLNTTDVEPEVTRKPKGHSVTTKSSRVTSTLDSIPEDGEVFDQELAGKTGNKKARNTKLNNGNGHATNNMKLDDSKINAEEGDSDGFFSVTCSETSLAPKMKFDPMVVRSVKELLEKLLFAVLVVEYKKPTQTYVKALVQAKIYLEASVRYLASLGVSKRAVFALVTDGVQGAVLMAWYSNKLEAVFIVERNLQIFNISSPIQVYEFMTVLLRLRKYSDSELKEAVQKALAVDQFEQTTWSKTGQYERSDNKSPAI